MVFWRGTAFRVRLARARRGASVPFGERMRVWGRARLSRFPLSNLPSPFVQNFCPYRIPLFDVPCGRESGGGVIVLLERNGFLERDGFSGAPCPCALGGVWTGALPRRKRIRPHPRARRGRVRACGERAFPSLPGFHNSERCPCVWVSVCGGVIFLIEQADIFEKRQRHVFEKNPCRS